MSRKDYIAIAKVINDELKACAEPYSLGAMGASAVGHVAEGLADVLAAENPYFDRARFLTACYGEEANRG